MMRPRHLVAAVLAALILGAVAGLLWLWRAGPGWPGGRAQDAAATIRGAAQRATQGSGGTDRGPAPARP